MSAYTKGPWFVAHKHPDSEGGIDIDANPDGRGATWIATVRAGRKTAGEVAANARLIAAAPLLLEALKVAYEALDLTDSQLESEAFEREKQAMDRAYDAIAKAIGEAK